MMSGARILSVLIFVYVGDYQSYRGFVSLQYVDVVIDELNVNESVIRALEDSGTELNIIRSNILESVVLPKIGRVQLRGIVGVPVMADLVKLHISLVNRSENGEDHVCDSVPIVCAVCPDLNEDMILTAALVNQLCGLRSSHDDGYAVPVPGELVYGVGSGHSSENLLTVVNTTEVVDTGNPPVADVAQVTLCDEDEQQGVVSSD